MAKLEVAVSRPAPFGGRAFFLPDLGPRRMFSEKPTIVGATVMQDSNAMSLADETDLDVEEDVEIESAEQIAATVLADFIEEIKGAPKGGRPAMLSAAA